MLGGIGATLITSAFTGCSVLVGAGVGGAIVAVGACVGVAVASLGVGVDTSFVAVGVGTGAWLVGSGICVGAVMVGVGIGVGTAVAGTPEPTPASRPVQGCWSWSASPPVLRWVPAPASQRAPVWPLGEVPSWIWRSGIPPPSPPGPVWLRIRPPGPGGLPRLSVV